MPPHPSWAGRRASHIADLGPIAADSITLAFVLCMDSRVSPHLLLEFPCLMPIIFECCFLHRVVVLPQLHILGNVPHTGHARQETRCFGCTCTATSFHSLCPCII